MQNDSWNREWFTRTFARILTGWYRALSQTSASGAVWEPAGGILTDNFKSRSGKQCDGVTRMLPALAAWAAKAENGETITLDDGVVISPRRLVRDALVNGTDPDHPDFWEYPPADRGQQRQVESSVVAWSLWLARDWLLPTLSKKQIENIQAWLAACTVFTDHYGNWALFTATNHAARVALADYGFSGDVEAIRRDLIVGNELYVGDGWMWDAKGRGLDYYNFWVHGSHHCYIRAMLPDYKNKMLDVALEQHQQRLRDLPYLIDADGQNVLFGRSLSYRWGWLSGLVAAHYLGQSPVDPGLTRAMLGRNIQRWLDLGSLNEHGVLRENLTAGGSDGGRDTYINCGHPYWGMQAFLCFALPENHAFWTAPAQPLPVERGDFLEPRQGPGLVLQGNTKTGEARLFNLRNYVHDGYASYEKFCYASGFPGNAITPKQRSIWDNQLTLRLADGSAVLPSEIFEVDTNDGRTLHVTWQLGGLAPTAPGAGGAIVGPAHAFRAMIHTTITVEEDGYVSEHAIKITGDLPPGVAWIEGGFTLGAQADQHITETREGKVATFSTPEGRGVVVEMIEGWETIHAIDDAEVRPACLAGVDGPRNIIHPQSRHHVLRRAATNGSINLASRHRAISPARAS